MFIVVCGVRTADSGGSVEGSFIDVNPTQSFDAFRDEYDLKARICPSQHRGVKSPAADRA